MRFYLRILLVANVLAISQAHAISFGWATKSAKAIWNVADVVIGKAIDQINIGKLFETPEHSPTISTDLPDSSIIKSIDVEIAQVPQRSVEVINLVTDKVESLRNVPVKKLVHDRFADILTTLNVRKSDLYTWVKNNPDEALKKAGLYTVIGAIGIYSFMKIDENSSALKKSFDKYYNNKRRLFNWSAGAALAAITTAALYCAHKTGIFDNVQLPTLNAPLAVASGFLTTNARTIAKITIGSAVGTASIGTGMWVASLNDEPALVITCKNLLNKPDPEFMQDIDGITNYINSNDKLNGNGNVLRAIFGDKDLRSIGVHQAAINWKAAQGDAKIIAKKEFDRQIQELQLALRLPNL